jgi:hypothetical protein
MTNARLQVALVPVLTLVTLWGLLALDPFAGARALFAKAEHIREGALVEHRFVDPKTQETSNGQSPLASFRTLEAEWCGIAKERRYVLSGNSQTLTVLLAPSEPLATEAEPTYPDLLLDRVRASGAEMAGYRLSAPNISYMEVLWYLRYLLMHPCLVPGEFIVQLNFETFRKTNVRDGMLELLADPTFLAAAEQEAQSDAPYAGTFQQAIDRYRARLAREKGGEVEGNATSRTGLAETHGIGGLIESRLREVLDRLPLFKSRADLKGELLDILYFVRVKFLGITPTTKRSLGGGTLTSNVASLQKIGDLCNRNGIRLVFFNAPQNPNAPLYRTVADRDQYLSIVAKLSRDYASASFDFEDKIPSPMWGVWIDGPDPIHFGRQAHHLLADLMFASGVVQRLD